MRRMKLGLIAASLGLTTGACGEDDRGGAAAPDGCVPGTRQICPGLDGCLGTQACSDDGTAFGPCQCVDESAHGGASGAGGQSSAGVGGRNPGGASGAAGTDPGGASGSGGAGAGASVGGSSSAGAGGSGGSGGSSAGAGGSGDAGAGAAPGGSCVGGIVAATCGNGVREPGEFCYLPPRVLPYQVDTGASLKGSDMADVTGDGLDDLVALVDGTSDALHVIAADTSGGLSARPQTNISGSSNMSLGLGQLTGDNHADAFVWKRYGSCCPESYEEGIFAGTAAGTFAATTWQDSPLRGSLISLPTPEFTFGDVNDDGLDDLIAAFGFVVVHPANSVGIFGEYSSVSEDGMSSTRVVLADLTGDGYPEILGGDGGNVSIGINDGTGVFSSWSQYPIAGNTRRPRAADVDADGFVDVVVGTNEAKVHVLRGNGHGGTIGDSVTHPVASSTVIIAYPLDVTNDGCLDIVAFHSGSVISVLAAVAPGVFDTYQTYPGLTGVAYAGDMNGDGAADFASAGPKSATVVLSNP